MGEFNPWSAITDADLDRAIAAIQRNPKMLMYIHDLAVGTSMTVREATDLVARAGLTQAARQRVADDAIHRANSDAAAILALCERKEGDPCGTCGYAGVRVDDIRAAYGARE